MRRRGFITNTAAVGIIAATNAVIDLALHVAEKTAFYMEYQSKGWMA